MSLVKLIEPPCTARYARWCERSAAIDRLLLDYMMTISVVSFMTIMRKSVAKDAALYLVSVTQENNRKE